MLDQDKQSTDLLLDQNAQTEVKVSDQQSQQSQSDQKQVPKKKLVSNPKKAIIFASLYALSFFVYQVVTKYTLNTGVSVLDLSMIRVLFLLAQSLVTAKYMNVPLQVPDDKKSIVIFRSFVGLTGFLCMGYGVYLMPLALNAIIFNTAPFWLFTMSYFFLGESMTPFQVVALFLCFGCVVIMALAKPADQDYDENSNGIQYTQKTKIIGSVMVLTTALCYSTVSLIARMLQTINVSVILVYYGSVASVVLFIAVCIQGLINSQFTIIQYTARQYGLVILAACLNAFGINAQTIAMQNENPAFISLVGYTGIIYAFFGDVLIFHVSFTTTELVCALILMCLTVTVIFMKLRNARIQQKKQQKEYEQTQDQETLDKDQNLSQKELKEKEI